MGFFSGLGRGLRGILDGAPGPQALIGGDSGAPAEPHDRQAWLRAAHAVAENARRKSVLNQLVLRGLDPAQAELALVNPDFARRFVPGFGSSRPIQGEILKGADHPGLEIQRGHPSFPVGFNVGGSQPDHMASDTRQPGRTFTADASPLPPRVDPLPLHAGNPASLNPATATWQGEPDSYGDELHLAGQDGFDRNFDIGIAQERARRTGRDYREVLNEMRGLTSGRQQMPGQPAPHPPAEPSPRPTTRAVPPAGQSVVPPAPRQADDSTQRPTGRTIRLTEADVLNLKRTLATEWVIRAGGPDQARGIIDTILNRLAAGRWGSTISEVVNQDRQFSDINGRPAWRHGRHSVEEIPDSRVSQVVSDFVDTYLAERAEGRASSVDTHLNYANPNSSDEINLPWIMALDGPVYGSGDAIHRHGTTRAWERYRPEPYSIELPTSPEQ